MATNFPTSLDSLTNPTGSDTLASPDHAGQHADANDAIEALQAKVGVDSSAVASSLDYKVAQKIDKTLVDAKGDLIVASAADTVGRLAVGATNGHVLMVDSAQTLGVKWAAAAGASDAGLESGTYYSPYYRVEPTSVSVVEDRTHYMPFYCPGTYTFDRIGIRTATVSGAAPSATVRLGIYNNSTTTGLPGTLLLDAGTVVCTASGTNYSITISQQLSVGWYWLAFNMQALVDTVPFYGIGTTTRKKFPNDVERWSLESTQGMGLRENSVTGAFADAVPVLAQIPHPFVALRVS